MAKKGSLGIRVTGEWGQLKKKNKSLANRKERAVAKRVIQKEYKQD